MFRRVDYRQRWRMDRRIIQRIMWIVESVGGQKGFILSLSDCSKSNLFAGFRMIYQRFVLKARFLWENSWSFIGNV